MNCLIVEDEKMAAERLKKLILELEPNMEILAITQTVKRSVEWLNTNAQPDLVFMDIQLADGLSFEIFEQVEGAFPVIFTTAYDEYALKAFKHNSIDYLLKPIQKEELKQAIEKFKSQLQASKVPQHIFDTLIQNFTKKYKSKFSIKIGEHIRIVNTDDVQCFYSLDKAVFLQNAEGRDYDVHYTLDQLEELLDPQKYFRINRKFIVALSFISDIVTYSNSRLRIKLIKNQSDELIVSRERVQDFKMWLEE